MVGSRVPPRVAGAAPGGLEPMTAERIQDGDGEGRTLAEIAAAIGASVVGDGTRRAARVVHPADARAPTDLALALEPEPLAALAGSRAELAAIAGNAGAPPGPLAGYLVADRPRLAFARLLRLFETPPRPAPGIHPAAVVEPSARIDPTASIGPLVWVGAGAEIGAGTVLLAQVAVGAEARIGRDCLLHPGVRIGAAVGIGDRVIIQHGASIGADGFSYITPQPGSIETARATGRVTARNTEILRIPSLGTVRIEDDVEIGANSTIDRATLTATVVGRGTKIDNLVMVGHNTTIGENCLIAGQVGISGSCRIGDRVVLAGQVGIADHVTIGDDAILMAQAGVGRDVPAGAVLIGAPAMPKEEFFSALRAPRRLKRLAAEVAELARRIANLEGPKT